MFDAQTSQPRALQIEQALACIHFGKCAGGLVSPTIEATAPVERERLFHCKYFWLSRLHGDLPFTVARRVCPPCWYVSRARAGSITAAPLMPPQKATCCCCRRLSEPVCSGRKAQ